MKGILREVAEHKLNIKPGSKSVKHCLHRFNDEKRKAIGEEIMKLLSGGFIQEVFHPEWLANHVLVKKKNKKWRMCVDFTSLNKVYLKDPFPLPRIDLVVDSTAGCETLCFLDAYSGYHQIAMCIADQLTTSFITPFGAYCYQTCSVPRAASRLKSLHSATRRMQPAAVQTYEEVRPLHMDPRGARGTRFSQEYAQESSNSDRSDP
jgi:hypothetical protein